jgi:hypothetical protein
MFIISYNAVIKTASNLQKVPSYPPASSLNDVTPHIFVVQGQHHVGRLAH